MKVLENPITDYTIKFTRSELLLIYKLVGMTPGSRYSECGLDCNKFNRIADNLYRTMKDEIFAGVHSSEVKEIS